MQKGVKDIEAYAFNACRKLKEIDIPENVRSIGYAAFMDCEELHKIKLMGDVPKIGENAFLRVNAILEYSEYVQRKSLCQLVYKKLEDIGTITAKQYQEVLKKYPLLSELYALTKEFCNVLFSNNPAKLDEWINEAQKYDIPELQTFINGIKKDLTAVKNGIIYSYFGYEIIL